MVSEICLRFPKYIYGSRNMLTVSEICLRFPKYIYGSRNMFTVSEIFLWFPKYIYGTRNIYNVSRCSSTPRVQYDSIRGTTRSLDRFPVRLRAVPGVFVGIPSPGCQLSRSCDRRESNESFRGRCRAVTGGYFRGGGRPYQIKTYNNIT
jgi:hypothetical protein